MPGFEQRRVVLLGVMAVTLGCGSGAAQAPAGPQTMAAPEEPSFEIGAFGVLREATRDRKLPCLMDAENQRVETPCFQEVRKPLTWETRNPEVLRLFEARRGDITASVLAWYKGALLPAEMQGVDTARWTFEIEKAVVRHVPPKKTAFAEDQACIPADRSALPPEIRTVTTLFGATELRFRSDPPLDRQRVKAMRLEAQKHKMRLVAVNGYTRATDEGGAPKVGPNQEKLFNSPTGELIPKKALPLPKDRLTAQWRLIMPKPLYFAFGDLPPDRWQREMLPDACAVFLVFDDAVPQLPECAQFDQAGFGARRAKTPGKVVIRVATQEDTFTREVPFGERSLIQAGGQILVWVTPKQIEEGAHLKIDSLVLRGADTPFREKTFPSSNKKRGSRKSKR